MSKKYKFRIYCVRGNHEARPQNVEGMHTIYDEDVDGLVYIQDKWPNIRYFKDFGCYMIDNFEVAVIGGAYSVDKFYRLEKGFRWFEDEQLTEEEMLDCTVDLTGIEADIVLTHTCPICWEPRDLFLPTINQSTVDKSMELFLEEIGTCFGWKVWIFAHYHRDRLERPGVEQFFQHTENIKDIWQRWDDYWNKGDLDWYIPKSPLFYDGDKLLASRREYWSNVEYD